MAETDFTAQIAEKVSDDVFGAFGWTRVGPINHDWACAVKGHVKPKAKASHSSDVVFWYDDPYRRERIYWTVDLKSYAAGTIDKPKVAGAVSSLTRTVECANAGNGWQDAYWDRTHGDWRCDGLLFVYNHDGAYTRDFAALIEQIDEENFKLPSKRRIAIVGPEEVNRLYNVVTDIRGLRAKGRLPKEEKGTQFWYPDLVGPKKSLQTRSAATIEMLLGPWITLVTLPEYHGGRKDYCVWYRERGDSVDEFKYLIDSFFRYQMIEEKTSVQVRFTVPNEAAVTHFSNAKVQMGHAYHGLADERLTRVTCEPITTFATHFSPLALGMER